MASRRFRQPRPDRAMAFRFRGSVPAKRFLLRGHDGVARPLQSFGHAAVASRVLSVARVKAAANERNTPPSPCGTSGPLPSRLPALPRVVRLKSLTLVRSAISVPPATESVRGLALLWRPGTKNPVVCWPRADFQSWLAYSALFPRNSFSSGFFQCLAALEHSPSVFSRVSRGKTLFDAVEQCLRPTTQCSTPSNNVVAAQTMFQGVRTLFGATQTMF